MQTQTLFQLCRTGYIALVLLLGGYFIQLGISGTYSFAFTALWIIPLLLPLRGIIKGNPYTYAWGSFILCLYELHALTNLWVAEGGFVFALIETILISLLLIGFPYYARFRGRELGLGLKKKKDQ